MFIAGVIGFSAVVGASATSFAKRSLKIGTVEEERISVLVELPDGKRFIFFPNLAKDGRYESLQPGCKCKRTKDLKSSLVITWKKDPQAIERAVKTGQIKWIT